MSILANKHVLVVGDETAQISKLEAALVTYGADVTSTTCAQADADRVIAQGIDLVFLNHLHEGSPCRTMLQELRAADGENAIPVVALVQNDDRHIQDALSIGASDYVTVDEDFYQIIEKIKMTLGGSTGVSNSTAIDITPQTIPQGDNIRVFAIEDDPLLRNLLAIRFEKSKLTFELAADAENVVAKAVAFKPQIIILDLMLPGKDGFTVLEELKQSAAADVPVLVFSNKDSHNDRKRASDLGAAAFHVKAMTDLSELITVIEKHAKPR